MNTKKLLSTVLVVLFVSLNGCGKEPERVSSGLHEGPAVEVTARIDPVVVEPGDVMTFTLVADYRPDVSLELPEVADALSEFRIVNSGVTQPSRRGERICLERWYKLQADMSGSYVIEPVEVAYSLADGTKNVAKTPRIFIEVESLLEREGEAKDIRDIKPPVPVSPSYRVLFLVSGVLIGTIALLLIGRKVFRRLKRRQEAKLAASRPPHEVALEALEELMRKKLLERGLAREFCFEISEIFRRYMQARFRIPAIDLTTDEILPRIEGDGIVEEELKPLIRQFLTSTDLVKFAQYRPMRNELDKIIEDARTFVEKTRPMPAAESESIASGGEAW